MPSTDSISALPPGISHEVDDLFAVGQDASDLDNLGNATSPNETGLAKAGTQADLGVEGLPGGLAAATASPAAPVVHTVGEASDVTPGHSLELSTPPSRQAMPFFKAQSTPTTIWSYKLAFQPSATSYPNLLLYLQSQLHRSSNLHLLMLIVLR